MPHAPAPSSRVTRRHFLAATGAAAGAAVLGRAPAVIGQQVRELHVWHTEVEPQTVKVIQDTSVAEFEKKFPGFILEFPPRNARPVSGSADRCAEDRGAYPF